MLECEVHTVPHVIRGMTARWLVVCVTSLPASPSNTGSTFTGGAQVLASLSEVLVSSACWGTLHIPVSLTQCLMSI